MGGQLAKSPHKSKPKVVALYGGSTRAASWSVARAGLDSRAMDLFGDQDHAKNCHSQQIASLNVGHLRRLLAELLSVQATPVLLPTGGWENLTGLAELAQTFFEQQVAEIFCADFDAVLRARDPIEINRLLDVLQHPRIPTREDSPISEIPATANWLRKPVRSVGGIGIRRLDPEDRTAPADDQYDQLEMPGMACSAQFLSVRPEKGAFCTKLLGCTKQIIDRTADSQSPYLYHGNVYPLDAFVTAGEWSRLSQQVSRLGALLAEHCGLSGLWGLDFLWHQQQVYLLEINPRYTAAMELIELAESRSLVREWLLGSCGEEQSSQPQRLPRAAVVGKRVLYAPHEWNEPAGWSWNAVAQLLGRPVWEYGPWEIPVISDVPQVGTDFQAGQPVCTIWGSGPTVEQCQQQLEMRFEKVRGFLFEPGGQNLQKRHRNR